MLRTYINKIKSGKEYLLQGWVHDIRNLAKAKFILLRDSTGIVQCIIKEENKYFKEAEKITPETVLEVEGKVKKAKLKSQELTIKNLEIEIKNLKIINKADKLPIHVFEKDKSITTDLSKRLDNRSLDIRKKEIAAIFKIQSELSTAFREYFKKNNFIEIQPPSVIASASEGGTQLYPVTYFEKKAYLAQSPQLYKQLCAISLEKVFTITPVWRAEPHNTTRHLNESRQMDIEVAFADDFQVMKYLEEVVKYMVEQVTKNCKEELKILDLDLKIPKVKYLNYKETIELLNKNKIKIDYGDDISPESEKKLCEIYPDTIIFIHSWPLNLKPFYIMPASLNEKENLSKGFDALYGGIEISSGGQRIHLPALLIKRLKANNLNPDNFKYYIDAFRYGAPYHSGWSIGLERFTMALLKLENIREACLFPRDRDRLNP